MLTRTRIGGLALAVLWAAPALAADQPQSQPQGPKSTTLLESTTTATGEALQYPTGATPKVTARMLELAPGAEISQHAHPMPVFVYLQEGSLTIQPVEGPARTYRAGEAFIETPGHRHTARNTGQTPARVVAVFMGAEGQEPFMAPPEASGTSQ